MSLLLLLHTIVHNLRCRVALKCVGRPRSAQTVQHAIDILHARRQWPHCWPTRLLPVSYKAGQFGQVHDAADLDVEEPAFRLVDVARLSIF